MSSDRSILSLPGMESVKRRRLEYHSRAVDGGGGRRQAIVRDCGDHLEFSLIGIFFLSDGTVLVQGPYVPDFVANNYGKIVKLPSLTFKLPKSLSLHGTPSFKKFNNEYRDQVAARATLSERGSPRLLLDTGAAKHCLSDRAMFSTYNHFVGKRPKLRVANGTTSDAHGYGNVVLKMTSSGLNLTLENAWHVPDASVELVSGSELGKEFVKLVFESGKALLSRNGQFIGDGYLDRGVFVINATIVYP